MFGELGDSDIYENNRGSNFDDTSDGNFSFDTQNDSDAGVSDDFLDTFDSDSLSASSSSEADYNGSVPPQFASDTVSVNAETDVSGDDLSGNVPSYAQQKSKSSSFVFIALLLVLAICAVGLFFYKKHTEQVSSEAGQAAADYFYDQSAPAVNTEGVAQPSGNPSADMATVDVDLATAEGVPAEANADVKNNSSIGETKKLSALEKAMQKKKADEEKENQVGLHTSIGSVVIPVSAGGRPDPFLPHAQQVASADKPKFDLVAPPVQVPDSYVATEQLMNIKINGIMYDEVRPSALIVVNDSEQLVHKGDVVMGNKILNITRKSVVVKCGTNVYEISAGQSLHTDVNLNPVSSVSRQFGGAYSPKAKNLLEFNK